MKYKIVVKVICIVLSFNIFNVYSQQSKKPNIVYVLCDDLGYGDIHAFAPKTSKIPTPNVDKLVSQGIRFTNAHSGSAVCTPTRYGLMTGRYAWRSSLQRGVVRATEGPLIDADRLTVASFLQNNGYHTGIVGKWHLNYNYQHPKTKEHIMPTNKNRSAGVAIGTLIPDGPVTRGFDYFYGYHHAGSMKTIVKNNTVVEEIEMDELLPLITSKAVDYIDDRAEEAKNGTPFFLYVPLSSPHGPIVPTKEWIGKSNLNLFGDFVMQTDWSVGQIMSALDRNGIADNTIVIFTSDNGTSPIAKFEDLNKKGHFSTAKLRGHKADIWDGGHRVPFVVRWTDGNIPAASQSDQLICLTDFMPTCAEILDTKLPEHTAEDAVSILPALYGKKIPKVRKAVVHHSVDGNFAIRKGKWKLILCSGSGGWSTPKNKKATAMGLPIVQLYDMKNDLYETTNLQAKHPRIVKKLTKLLEEYIENGRSTPGVPLTNDVPIDIWKL